MAFVKLNKKKKKLLQKQNEKKNRNKFKEIQFILSNHVIKRCTIPVSICTIRLKIIKIL